jgi:hypothetical protein
VWYKKNDIVPTTALYSLGPPTVGNSIIIETLPTIKDLELDLIGVAALPGGLAWPQRQYTIDSVMAESLSRRTSSDRLNVHRGIIFGSRLAFQNAENRLFSGFTKAPAVACLLWTADNSAIYCGGSFLGLCVLNVTTVNSVSAGPFLVANGVFQAATISHLLGMGYILDVQIFDVVGATSIAIVPWLANITNLSGNNNAGIGYGLNNRLSCGFEGTQNLTGAVANVKLLSTTGVALPLTVTLSSLLPIADFARSGTAKLVAGTVTVTVPYIDWTIQRLTFGRSTPGGTIGDISAPTASRTTTTFVLNSTNALDTSDVQWSISPLGRNIFIANAV